MRRLLAMVVALGLMTGAVMAESSAIKATAYNAEAKVLTVTYESGEVYEYTAVPQSVADAVEKAESKGKAVNDLVKGKFTAKKVEK